MREVLPSSAVRIETLQREMPPSDIRCLRESDSDVRRFLAVARRLDFFQRSPDSEKAGYDIATYRLLPEAPLASLIHADQNKDEPRVLAEQWFSRMQRDPEAFMQSLID